MNYFLCAGGRSTHQATKITVAKTPLATFSGNVSGLNLAETIAYIVATQSGPGTPSPTNPRSIVGVDSVETTCCGKNLFNGTNVINAYFSSNGTITASGATRLVYSRCKANTTYTVSKTAGARFGVAYSEEVPVAGLQCSGYTANNTASSITITTGATAKYICAYVYHSSYDSGTAQDMLDSVQIEEGTATAYEAYNGTTATTALGGTYYGGYLNVPTGLLTVTHLIANLGDCSFTGTVGSTGIIGTTSLVDVIKPVANADTANAYCSHYLVSRRNSIPDNAISVNPTGTVVLRDSAFADQSGTNLQTWLASNNVQFVYELATPQTVQLTPAQLAQLLGQNNVFCSTGDVAVKYWKID